MIIYNELLSAGRKFGPDGKIIFKGKEKNAFGFMGKIIQGVAILYAYELKM